MLEDSEFTVKVKFKRTCWTSLMYSFVLMICIMKISNKTRTHEGSNRHRNLLVPIKKV